MNTLSKISIVFITIGLLMTVNSTENKMNVVLLDEDFSGLQPGMFSSGVVGAHAEYHYIPEVAPKGNWVVSCFRSNESQRAWRVLVEDGDFIMYQSYLAKENERNYTHPMLITGDPLWTDYSVQVRFAPESAEAQSGVVFRYHNDRCYYFFGVEGNRAILKWVNHADGYRTSNQKILAEKQFSWLPNQYLTAQITVTGQMIQASLNDSLILDAKDSMFQAGKVGLTSDVPTRYSDIKISTSLAENKKLEIRQDKRWLEIDSLQKNNPKMVLWKKIYTDGFGVGRSLRFGDLNNDGQIDVLIGQVNHHGPKDRNSEVGCLTAMTFDGEILWQSGEPDLWKDNLTNDVAFQIHDLDRDGKNEVIYSRNFELVVADGVTGKTKYKTKTPINKFKKAPYNKFHRILGDCLYFCDLRGNGYPQDIIIKDRYQNFWALNDKLEVMWEGSCVTGHYPFAYDVDGDGKDELAIGYSLFDHDGTKLWSLDDHVKDHCDGVAVVDFQDSKKSSPVIMNAASDEGMMFIDLRGNILKHHYLGHVQNPAVANFRDDLPGLETVSINFWGNQGIIHYFDSKGDLYYDFEPVQHGSMMLPINWTGKSEGFYVLSANVREGGLYDGWGRRVVCFPADGHPDMCNAVLDITGDCRDEIVVWDPGEIWVYTQSDNPKTGKLYKPVRNSLSNYSNYQATVSLPGWSGGKKQ